MDVPTYNLLQQFSVEFGIMGDWTSIFPYALNSPFLSSPLSYSSNPRPPFVLQKYFLLKAKLLYQILL